MKYNIVIARTDANLFEFFDQDGNGVEKPLFNYSNKEESEEAKKKIPREKIVSYEDIIILNDLEVKEVKLVSQGSRLDYEDNKSIEKLKTKADTDFGLVIEGKIIPTAKTTYEEIVDVGKKLKKEFLNSASSSTWLSTLNGSICNINQLKVWAECYGKYQDKKYPLLSEKAGQVMEEQEPEEGMKKKRDNLLDYRDVLLTIKVSDEHTLQYKFNQLFVGDYTEKFSSGEGVGEYKLQLGQRLINKIDPNNRFTVVETERVESKLKKLKEMLRDYDGKFEKTTKNEREDKRVVNTWG